MALRGYNDSINEKIEEVINEASDGLKYHHRDISESRIQHLQNQVLVHGDEAIRDFFLPPVAYVLPFSQALLALIRGAIEDKRKYSKNAIYYKEIAKYHHLTGKLLEEKDGETQTRIDYLYTLNRILNYLKEILVKCK